MWANLFYQSTCHLKLSVCGRLQPCSKVLCSSYPLPNAKNVAAYCLLIRDGLCRLEALTARKWAHASKQQAQLIKQNLNVEGTSTRLAQALFPTTWLQSPPPRVQAQRVLQPPLGQVPARCAHPGGLCSQRRGGGSSTTFISRSLEKSLLAGWERPPTSALDMQGRGPRTPPWGYSQSEPRQLVSAWSHSGDEFRLIIGCIMQTAVICNVNSEKKCSPTKLFVILLR